MRQKDRSRKGARDPDWNLEKIQKLIDLLAEREIGEFEMERNGFRVRIRRDSSKRPDSPTGEPAQARRRREPLGSAPAPITVAALSPEATAAAEPAAESAEDVFVIKSPIVGTFYASPAPNAPPFVKLHDSVQVGQVLCI